MLKQIFVFFSFLFFSMISSAAIDCEKMDKDMLLEHASMLFGQSCEGAVKSAEGSCNQSGGMDPSAMSALSGGGSQLQQALPGPAGIAEACRTEAGMHKMAMMMNGMFQASCGAAVGACNASCEVSTGDLNAAIARNALTTECAMRIRSAMKSERKKCEALSSKSNQAMSQMMMSAMQSKLAEQCVVQAEAKNAELVAMCKTHPRDPQCVNANVDCSNPDNARTHPKCICRDPAMAASHPVCSPNGQTGVPPGTQAGDFASKAADGRGTRRLSNTSLESLLADPEILPVKEDPNRNGGVDANQKVGSGGGPRGGDNFGSDGRDRGGRYVGPFETDILKGMASSKGGSGIPGARDKEGNGFNLGLKPEGKDAGGVDLSKFIPQGSALPGMRGIASAEMKDGITGAMGPSIWEKISSRYKKVQPFLEP